MRRRRRRSADLQGQARQFDLFGPPRAAPDPPLWRMLPEETRRTATSLSLLRVGRERPNGWAILVWCGRRESRSCQEPIQLTYASECYGSASAAS